MKNVIKFFAASLLAVSLASNSFAQIIPQSKEILQTPATVAATPMPTPHAGVIGSAVSQNLKMARFEQNHPRFANFAQKHPQFANRMFDNRAKLVNKNITGKDIWKNRSEIARKAHQRIKSKE